MNEIGDRQCCDLDGGTATASSCSIRRRVGHALVVLRAIFGAGNEANLLRLLCRSANLCFRWQHQRRGPAEIVQVWNDADE
jgi:hypothetical protein